MAGLFDRSESRPFTVAYGPAAAVFRSSCATSACCVVCLLSTRANGGRLLDVAGDKS